MCNAKIKLKSTAVFYILSFEFHQQACTNRQREAGITISITELIKFCKRLCNKLIFPQNMFLSIASLTHVKRQIKRHIIRSSIEASFTIILQFDINNLSQITSFKRD